MMWLGYEDSNLGMLVSETRALPLGDTPKVQLVVTNILNIGWGTRIRTSECWYQKPEPYRLAIPQSHTKLENSVLYLCMVATTGFEPVTPSL